MLSFEVKLLGHNLQLSQDPNSMHLGTTVWDSSLVFAKYLERNSKKGQFSRSKTAGKRVIELGAGCGLAGLSMALLGCDVVMTDQTEVLPLLKGNVERNLVQARYTASDNPSVGSIGNVEVAELDWGNKNHIAAVGPPFDYVIGTDVVYVEHLLQPLIETILCLAGPKSTIMLGYEFRDSAVREKLHTLCAKHFNIKRVLQAKMDPTYRHPSIELYIMRQISSSIQPFLGLFEKAIGGCISNHVATSSKGLRAAKAIDEATNVAQANICTTPERSSLTDSAEPHETQSPPARNGKGVKGCDDVEGSDEEPEVDRSTAFESKQEETNSSESKSGQSKRSLPSECTDTTASSEASAWEVRRLGSSAARLLSGISISPP